MSVEKEIEEICRRAKKASRDMARARSGAKNRFLEILALRLEEKEVFIRAANDRDVAAAAKAGMDGPRLDRLTLKDANYEEMRAACLDLAAVPDPVGATETQWQRPNGLLVGRMRIPLGVIAMIYESRPNVTIDAAVLCIKAGNAVILRGGAEAAQTNAVLADILRDSLKSADLPADAVQLVDKGGHEAVNVLCGMDEYIDVIIPRGGENLVRSVCEKATMPVLKHYKGVCHAYVDRDADVESTCAIVENSKCQRPGVCNSLECLLVNREIAPVFLPALAARLAPAKVEFRADEKALPLLGKAARPLEPEDLGTEFMAQILAIVIVDDMEAALAHIDRYGSHHTEIICTKDYERAMRFLREADASMVAVNASTRFNDGGQLGLGAEIGISTSKIHAYGPMGIRELTTTKFVVLGAGQTRN